MKKWLLFIGIILSITLSAQAKENIAIVNMGALFQQIAQKNNISLKLENEFKGRENELKRMEDDLQSKMHHLQTSNHSTMKESERNKLEKDIIFQRQNFSQKAQAFEQDRQRRSSEERNKLINLIQTAVRKVATGENIDLVVDTNAIIFNSISVKDITNDVIKQVE